LHIAGLVTAIGRLVLDAQIRQFQVAAGHRQAAYAANARVHASVVVSAR
jgi:hypothetical protein